MIQQIMETLKAGALRKEVGVFSKYLSVPGYPSMAIGHAFKKGNLSRADVVAMLSKARVNLSDVEKLVSVVGVGTWLSFMNQVAMKYIKFDLPDSGHVQQSIQKGWNTHKSGGSKWDVMYHVTGCANTIYQFYTKFGGKSASIRRATPKSRAKGRGKTVRVKRDLGF